MEFAFSFAEATDAPALAALQNRVHADLSRRYPGGPWTSNATERSMLFQMQRAKTLLVRNETAIVGMLHLKSKKPWAIDLAYFTPVQKAIYLVGMAVDPAWHGKGVGSALLAEAARCARHWPADAIRLDAYDRPGGAGGFYERHGFAHRGRAVYRKSPLLYFELLLTPLAG